MELTQVYQDYFTTINLALEQGKMFYKLENTSDQVFKPTKNYPSDAGWDCRARIDQPIVLEPGRRVKIHLGFGINIPLHHTGDLRPRSGLTDEYGIIVGYGTIDAGYTGELKATLFNFGEETFVVNPKDRIAQLVVLPLVKTHDQKAINLFETDQLRALERGNKGHGSSGVK